MLAKFRNLAQSKIGIPIIALMILGMAAFGIENIFSGNFGSYVIKSGDRSTSEAQLNRKFENYLNNVRSEDPSNAITRQDAVEQGLLDQIFNVERSRLTNLGYARTLGADASTDALLEDVGAIEEFKNPLTGEFDSQYYRNALARGNLDPRDFEGDWQDRLTLNYIRDGITAALVPPLEISRVQAIYDGEVRYISWLPIERASLPELAEPTAEELQTFYTENQTAFEAPERRQLTILNLSSEDFLHQADVTEEKILAAYETSKNLRMEIPEQRTFEELVFTDEEMAKAAFGTLVVGGELTDQDDTIVTVRTLTADKVASEAFRVQLYTPGVEVGAVVGPIELNGSWVVGRLTEIIPGTPKTLEDTREEIIAEVAGKDAEIAFYTAQNEVDGLIGQGLSVEEIGAQFGAPVITFAPVDQRGLTEQGEFLQALTVSPEAFTQAFEFPEGEITDRFDQNLNTVLIAIDKIVPASTPPFEAVRDRVEQGYKVTKENEALQSAANAVKAVVESGASTLAEQASIYDSEVQTPERGLRRTAFDRTLPQSVLRAGLTQDEDTVTVAQGRTPTELILVRIDQIERPKPEELDVLAPISAPKIAEQLSADLLQAFELEVENAMSTETNNAAFGAYKARLLENQ